jgi:enoyl-CoA hydratase/carnithine racemase
LYQTELTWLARSEVPVIAAINGAALGGGLELALLCDLRVAAEHAVFGLPETSLGIIPASGGTQRLPRAIGEARAKEMILFCRRIDASEALRIGLINRVSPAQKSVVEDALEWMAPILHGAPIALKNALAAIDAAFELSLDQGLELERVFYEECLRSEDRQEALRAFAEKRSPKFTGR